MYLTGGWDIPPAYHGNPWAAGGVGELRGFVYEPLFFYIPASEEFTPRLGLSFKEDTKRNTLEVTLRSPVWWHNGERFTSEDVLTTFYIGYLQGWPIWLSLLKIEATSPDKVVFYWKSPLSTIDKIRALTEYITSPKSIYYKWAKDTQELFIREKKLSLKEKNVIAQKIREDLYRFRPPLPVGTGPFKATLVTATDAKLDFFEKHWAKDKISIDGVRFIRCTSNEVMWALLMAGEIDASNAATPRDVAEEILKSNPNLHLLLPSDLAEVGILFNCKKAPFSDIHFRKALAYALDRNLIKEISYYFAQTSMNYSLGVIPSYCNKWLSKSFIKSLQAYPYNVEKAIQTLKEAGYKQNTSGEWLTSDGKKINIEISVPAGNSDWVLGAETITSQWGKLGIPTKVRILQPMLYNMLLREGNFDVIVDFVVDFHRYGHPATAYERLYSKGGTLAIASGLSSKIKGPSGEVLDLPVLSLKLFTTNSKEEQRKVVKNLAWVTDNYLPIVPIYEKQLMVYVLDGKHITGWAPKDDPVWSAVSNGIVSVYAELIVRGRLKGVK